MAIDDCSFQGQTSQHSNDISESIHMHQIHDNVLLEVMERVIMFFSMQMQVQWQTLCVITPIPN
jgi:hypothetical protein